MPVSSKVGPPVRYHICFVQGCPYLSSCTRQSRLCRAPPFVALLPLPLQPSTSATVPVSGVARQFDSIVISSPDEGTAGIQSRSSPSLVVQINWMSLACRHGSYGFLLFTAPSSERAPLDTRPRANGFTPVSVVLRATWHGGRGLAF